MKMKKHVFRIGIAVLAFIFGIVNLYECNALQEYFRSRTTNNSAFQNKIKAEIAQTSASPAGEQPIREEPVATNAQPQQDFDASGAYYSEDDLPKGFETFEVLDLQTNDYEKISDVFPMGEPIPPKGSINFNKEYKFSRIAVSASQIAFETQAINGIKYRFSGQFYIDQNDDPDLSYPRIKGHLVKLKNGAKIAKADIRLYQGGC